MGGNKKSYEYILIDDIFVNVNQNVLKLYYNLYKRAKPFEHFNRIARRWLPSFLLRAIRILQFTQKYVQSRKKYYTENSIPSIVSQHDGNCLVKLRQGGYKIFNFKKGIVITTYPRHIPLANMNKRIKKIKTSEKCILAPRLINCNIKERFLVEEYQNMRRCSYNLFNVNRFIIKISPILGEIISVDQPKHVNQYQYSLDKIQYIESHINKSPRGYNNEDSIKQFLNYLKKKFAKNIGAKNQVMLVFSHGDLWEGNILSKGKQAGVIDWDTIGCRSFYYDFYFSIFMLASKGKHFDQIDYESLTFLNNELDTSVMLYSKLLESFKRKNNHSMIIPKQFDLYRYLFYIELLVLKLKETHNSQKENVNEVDTWIERFRFIENLRT